MDYYSHLHRAARERTMDPKIEHVPVNSIYKQTDKHNKLSARRVRQEISFSAPVKWGPDRLVMLRIHYIYDILVTSCDLFDRHDISVFLQFHASLQKVLNNNKILFLRRKPGFASIYIVSPSIVRQLQFSSEIS